MIDFLVSFIRLEIFRFYAKTFVYGYKSINSTDFASDMIKFKDLYAGPEYYFYYRVAQITLLCIICLIMGTCMPLLYFVAAWGLFVNYVVDRLALAYYYKLPSKFNEKLTKTAIHTLNFLPLFTLPFIFWLYTNQ